MSAPVAAMTDPQDEPSTEALEGRRRRRNNIRLAVAHALLALGFLVAFIWVQVHK